MILVPLLVLVVVVVVVVALLGGGAALGLGGRRRGEGGLGGTGAGLALLVVGAVVVVALVAMVALVGVRGGRGGGDDDGRSPVAGGRGSMTSATGDVGAGAASAGGEALAPSAGADSAATEGAGATERGAARPAAGPGPGPEIHLVAAPEPAFPPPPPLVGDLPERAVVVVRAAGFEPDTTGDVAQCTVVPDGKTRCARRFPVRFDDTGEALVQYLVDADLGHSRCGPRTACALVVTGPRGRRASATTVFGAPAPRPGRVGVTPVAGLGDGQAVTVTVGSYPPGTRVAALQCAAPALAGAERCGPPARAVVGADGRASVALTVDSGPVGLERRPCGRGQACGVSVVVEGVGPVAAAVPVTFAAPPGARYAPARLAAGLLAAAVLLAVAAWLVRTTDWAEPTEAATPDLDRVVLVP